MPDRHLPLSTRHSGPSTASWSRRSFLKHAAVAAAAATAGCAANGGDAGPSDAPEIVPASAVGLGRPAPSERITLGFIGIGNMGRGHLGGFLGNRDVQILAVSDVRQEVRETSRQRVESAYASDMQSGAYKGCDMYPDFRDLLARRDIDSVLIATPEHWHAIMVIQAAQAGKDIYCEKPLSHTIREAQLMVDAVRRYGRVFQTGSQQRSSENFRRACELVRSGRIGSIKTVHVSVGGTSHHAYFPAEPVPPGLDWNMWLGPAPWAPYNTERASGSYSGGWRLIRDYSGGMMTDWGAHHFDIAQWGLGMDESGPVEIYPPDGRDHPVLTYRYANGVAMYHMHGPGASKIELPFDRRVNGVLFVGEDGCVEVNRGHLATSPEHLAREPLHPDDVHLYQSRNHARNWIDCMRSRQRPICDVEVGARTITVCHLGNLAYWLNRPLRWDPVQQTILGDETAAGMLAKPMRAPWHV